MNLPDRFLNALNLDDFVVLDLETTGLDPEKDRIIEIGAVRFVDGVETDSFQQLVNPGMPIPNFITKLTGITDQDVADAPEIESVFDALIRFIDESTVVGHQINFDAAFVEYQFRRDHRDFRQWENELHRFQYFRNTRFDTLFLARIFLPFLSRIKLGAVAAYFGIDLENAHRAIDDARATGHILFELLERMLACDNRVLQSIIKLLNKNSNRAKSYFIPVLEYKQKYNVEMPNSSFLQDLTANQQLYNIIGEADFRYDLSESESPPESISTREISDIISQNGKLQPVIPNFEEREQQKEMSRLIGEVFNNEEFLVVEAGTGTGKSMAYLLPAVKWAVQNRKNGERVIISTNTKNLQEQLFYKDIPTIYKIADQKFKAVLLKGKSNYLCLDKWKSTIIDMDQRLSQQERSRILPLMIWAEQTQTGDIAENSGFQVQQNWGLWSKLIAENNYCPGRTCKFYNDCFLIKARNNAKNADIVIVNHSLLFSDLSADNSILGPYQNLVIDEAHNTEKTAADYMGVRFNWWTFRNVYHKLYEEEPKKAGSLVQLEYRLSKGSVNPQIKDAFGNRINRLKTESIALKRISNQFFNELCAQLREKFQKKSPNNFDESRIRYFKNFKAFSDLDELIQELKLSVAGTKQKLSQVIDVFANLKMDSFEFQDQLQRELISIENDLEMLSESFEFCIAGDEKDYVYWLELPLNPTRNDVLFNAVPLNISDLLRKNLFDHLKTAVFTSATLAVDGQFDYFNQRIGLSGMTHKNVRTAKLGSPFNFDRQILFGVADFLDDPRNEEFTNQIADLLKNLHQKHNNGILVLFTNYSMLNYLYEKLKPYFDAEKILLLAQGKSGSRTNIINQFREYKNSVLFGTDSFWEGIDVPGEALELLVITKLPFDVPSEPVIAARMEKIKNEGGNPFFDYSVPEAIIKFRQGFGRLIRHKNDFGAVIACDNRLSRMKYGEQFLSSLPVSAEIYRDEETLHKELKNWFTTMKPKSDTE